MHKAIPKSSGISKRIVGGAMVAAVVLLASSLTVSEMQNQPANATAGCATDWTLIGSVCELRVTSDRSVVLPASITTYDLLLVGGGGGGGGAGGIPNGGNAGGGGGGEVKLLTSQSLSGTLVIDVGAGGAGGPNETTTAIPATPGLEGSSTLLSGALVASALAGGGGQQGAFFLTADVPINYASTTNYGKGGTSGNNKLGGAPAWNPNFGEVASKGTATEKSGGGAGDGAVGAAGGPGSSGGGGVGSAPSSGLFTGNTSKFGGGGGAANAAGGDGGGGLGGIYNRAAGAGTANTGGGGGGAGGARDANSSGTPDFENGGGIGGAGAAGIVILRYSIASYVEPSAPISPSATAGDATATVTWGASATGTAPITYTVTPSPNTPAGVTCVVTGLSAACSPLTNGQSYIFTVTATNGAGYETATATAVTPVAPSRPSPAVTEPPVVSPPAAPTEEDVDVEGEDGNLEVKIDEPAPSEAKPESYEVTIKPSGETCTIVLPNLDCTVSGLKNMTEYKISITAVNALGESTFSPKGRYLFSGNQLLKEDHTKVLAKFNGGSAELLTKAKLRIKSFVSQNTSAVAVVCVGFAAGDRSALAMSVAKNRAIEACESIKTQNPELSTRALWKNPENREIPRNRKVVLRSYISVF